MPRTPDGKPILDGPTPRTADGKVDFSGIWELRGGSGGRGRGAGPTVAPRRGPPCGRPLASRVAILRGRRPRIRAAVAAWAAEVKKKRMADKSKDNPDIWCLPIGLMQYHNHPQPRQIVWNKNLILIACEVELRSSLHLSGWAAGAGRPDTVVVRILARPQGDTLVVETTNFRGDEKAGWLDVNSSPYTEALKMAGGSAVEFRRAGDRHYDRRSQSVLKPFRAREPSPRGRHGDDRIHLQRDRKIERPRQVGYGSGTTFPTPPLRAT